MSDCEAFGIDFSHSMAIACRRQGLRLEELPIEVACDASSVVRMWYEPVEDEV